MNVEIIWEQHEGDDEPWQAVLGVWVGPTDADVITWGGFEFAYGTDGGTGGTIATFSNGFGDGGFPLSRGRNADGDVVAVVIWRADLPWRLAIPAGTPPADVMAREEDLIECLAGERAIDVTGQCEWEEFD